MVVVLAALAKGNIIVMDVNRCIIFVAKEHDGRGARKHRIICDPDGRAIVTLKPKFWTTHGRCKVFRGDSKESRDLIFTAKTHSMLNTETNLDVFLASNREEKMPDFNVKGNFSEKSYTIYAGNVIIARLQKVDDIVLGKDSFMVKVNPNVDSIFVLALALILEKMTSTFKVTPAMAMTALSCVVPITNVAAGQISNG